MGRGKPPIGVMKKPVKKIISKQDRKDLRILADDFGFFYRKEVQEIIENSRSYAEWQQKIMRYMFRCICDGNKEGSSYGQTNGKYTFISKGHDKTCNRV